MSKSCYVVLFDDQGYELGRKRIPFENRGDHWVNAEVVEFHALRSCMIGDMGLASALDGPTIMRFTPNLSSKYVVIGSGIVMYQGSVVINGVFSDYLFRPNAEPACPTYEDWMKDKQNTPIHPQDIWDAAFLAGSQFTRILLTGEPNG